MLNCYTLFTLLTLHTHLNKNTFATYEGLQLSFWILLSCHSSLKKRIDWVKVLRPARHKNRLFWSRSSQPISWLSTEKLNKTQQKQSCICNKIYHNKKLTQKQKPGLAASYDLRAGNGMGPLWKVEKVDR